MSRGPLQSDGGVDRQRQVVGGDLAVGAGEAVSHGRGSGWAWRNRAAGRANDDLSPRAFTARLLLRPRLCGAGDSL